MRATMTGQAVTFKALRGHLLYNMLHEDHENENLSKAFRRDQLLLVSKIPSSQVKLRGAKATAHSCLLYALRMENEQAKEIL